MQDDVKAGAPEDAAAKPKPKDWLAIVLAANPWIGDLTAQGHKIDENDPAFVAARKAESLKRFQAGREAWSKWAGEMQVARDSLEAAGKWDMGKDVFGSPEPKTPETKTWLAAASVDFRGHCFESGAVFHSLIFPGNADFNSAPSLDEGRKPQPTIFEASALFSGTTFKGYAEFYKVTFEGNAGFEGATFEGRARFGSTKFEQGECLAA